jgi:hypothetical protein
MSRANVSISMGHGCGLRGVQQGRRGPNFFDCHGASKQKKLMGLRDWAGPTTLPFHLNRSIFFNLK